MASGIGSNPVSVNQTPQYGDKKALEDLKRGTTTLPTGNPAPRPGSGPTPTPQPGPPVAGAGVVPSIPQEHTDMIANLARAAKTAKVLNDRAQSVDAGPWLKYYAALATARYAKLARQVKYGTPFFKGQ